MEVAGDSGALGFDCSCPQMAQKEDVFEGTANVAGDCSNQARSSLQ